GGVCCAGVGVVGVGDRQCLVEAAGTGCCRGAGCLRRAGVGGVGRAADRGGRRGLLDREGLCVVAGGVVVVAGVAGGGVCCAGVGVVGVADGECLVQAAGTAHRGGAGCPRRPVVGQRGRRTGDRRRRSGLADR